MNKNELAKELGQRGTAEIGNGVVNQVTQALDEAESEITFLIFGEKKTQKIIPIDEACAKCNFWEGKFTTTTLCQNFQSGDAKARGFNKLVCPQQFKE
jgi:hypothetical protein